MIKFFSIESSCFVVGIVLIVPHVTLVNTKNKVGKMAKKTKLELRSHSSGESLKDKLARESKITKRNRSRKFSRKWLTQDIGEPADPMREMQIEFKRAAERMEIALADQIERTTQIGLRVSYATAIRRKARNHA